MALNRWDIEKADLFVLTKKQTREDAEVGLLEGLLTPLHCYVHQQYRYCTIQHPVDRMYYTTSNVENYTTSNVENYTTSNVQTIGQHPMHRILCNIQCTEYDATSNVQTIGQHPMHRSKTETLSQSRLICICISR